MSNNLQTALRGIVGKTVAAVHHETVRYAPSGKAIKYAIADGEQLASNIDEGNALIEFTNGTLLLISATYDTTLDAKVVSVDDPFAQRILRSGKEG